MAGTKEGAMKARQTKIKKAGGLEAYQEKMKKISSMGGKVKRPRPFDIDPRLAAEAGLKGRANRYYRGKTQG